VTAIPARLSCITAIAGILTLAAVPLVAAFTHEACVVRHHGCMTVLTAADCCDGEHKDVSNRPATAVPRDEAVRNTASALSTTPDVFDSIATLQVAVHPANASPPTASPDLRILFCDLRI
jgi:hypothetical protein